MGRGKERTWTCWTPRIILGPPLIVSVVIAPRGGRSGRAGKALAAIPGRDLVGLVLDGRSRLGRA
jgi:hypothetical protein